MAQGNEMYYKDENGKKQDASLWDEILGDDDQDTIQLEDLAETESAGESEPSVPLGKVDFTR